MRLIDADLLKEKISKWLKPSKPDETEMIEVTDALVSTMIEIEEQPTAFDVDKVVEQMEELKKAEQNRPDNCDENGFGDGEQIYDDGRSQGRFEAFGEAIEIVKGGGVE